MADSALAVEARDVVKVFGNGASAFRALDGVSVAIGANEFFTLLGPSGCGKTTLLRLIAGFEFPSAGTIRLDGKDIASEPPYRRPVNTVFQSYALFPHMTVERNVAFGLEMLGRPRADIARRVDEVLALVRMEALRGRATSALSGGQQQRVALARALAPSPAVLLLDEPLSALDYQLRKEMQIELKRMQHETGITFVFVTHDQEEALTMSDRVAVMSAGHILQVGTPREIYERPADRFVASFIGESNFLDGTIEGDAATPGRDAERASAPGGAAEGMRGVDAGAGGALGDGAGSVTELVPVRLDAGGTLLAERGPRAPRVGRCTLVVRPEHVRLARAADGGFENAVRVAAGDATGGAVTGAGGGGADDTRSVEEGGDGHGRLAATLATIVYSGTDTHHHATLADGSRFIVRSQNRRAAAGSDGRGVDAAPCEGERVVVHVAPGIARVLDETP